jgi:uracil-DNA glycosylase family 4
MRHQSLQNLHVYWDKQNTCSLKQTATQAVFGDGNPHAEIVFIGEAPGKDEDLTGKPFVGRAGKFLNELLSSIELNRKDVYITNTVKYRPPENRDPLPEEKISCQNWLFDELNMIHPKLIVLLGRHAMSTYFPTEKISEVHGKLIHRKFATLTTEHFLILYHPAAALYNGKLRDTLFEDFKKIPKILMKVNSK